MKVILMKLIDSALALAAVADRFYDRILAKAWVSYALISALQLKILWKIWQYRDLTTGDTSAYFTSAARWADNFAVNIVWSPLYTAYYGSLYWLTEDVYYATIIHRMIIVVVATLGVLALMRRLLPPAMALLIAAWWAVLPINFETLYEVHLFALLPILAAWLVAGLGDTPSTRGTALAILLATFVLVRNEILIAAAIFALICLVREVRARRRLGAAGAGFWHTRLSAYGIPAMAGLGVCAVFYGLSYVKYPAMLNVIDSKHNANMCQVYAFGHGQRHPEWTLSPWLECGPLMEATFGRARPSLAQMFISNPSAAFEHFWWNASLTPNGLQLALFNSMSGTVNPDYAAATHSFTALVLSAVAVAVVIAGGVKAALHWNVWWPGWFRERRGLWLIMLSVVCVAIPVILSQRPRPSYLFSLTLVMMAMIGSAAYVLLEQRWLALSRALAVIGIPLLLIFIPPYYSKYRSDRPLYVNYERLRPFQALLAMPRNKLLLGDYAGEFKGYLQLGASPLDYGLLQSWKAPQSLEQFLDAHHINILFVQPRVMQELRARPESHQLLEHPTSLGWRRLAPFDDSDSTWLLLYREPRVATSGRNDSAVPKLINLRIAAIRAKQPPSGFHAFTPAAEFAR
jgi:hypothetical protein